MSITSVLSVVWFVVGFFAGILSVIMYVLMKLRSLDKKAKKLNSKTQASSNDKASNKLTKSAKDRLIKAFEITERQLTIMGALDSPQSGPLHGKYKNTLNSELKALEQEKMDILKSVLDDGFDPKLTILNSTSGEKEVILLSEFMNQYNKTETETPPPPPSKPKLRIVKSSDKKTGDE
jgi:hypothetical protein